MSNAPHLAKGLRSGKKMGDIVLADAMLWDGLTCASEHCHMGLHAEHIAERFDVPREDQDQYALTSQTRAADAWEKGYFDREIAAVTTTSRRGKTIVERDECPRGETSLEDLAKLRTAFLDGGTVTAGNSSTLSDGAAAVVVASEKTARTHKHPLQARILSYHTSGTEPRDLFIAPVSAIQGALAKADLSIDQIDYFEINEAFASQSLACIRELNIDLNKVNIQGGGISLGHPIGASGARTLVTLLHTLHRTNTRYGVVSLCLGGGNAVAMVIEK